MNRTCPDFGLVFKNRVGIFHPQVCQPFVFSRGLPLSSPFAYFSGLVWSLILLISKNFSFINKQAPCLSFVLGRKVSSHTLLFVFRLQHICFCPSDFHFLDIYVYFFLRSFTFGSRQWTFLRITPFSLFGGCNPSTFFQTPLGAPRVGSVDVNLQPGRQAVATATAA